MICTLSKKAFQAACLQPSKLCFISLMKGHRLHTCDPWLSRCVTSHTFITNVTMRHTYFVCYIHLIWTLTLKIYLQWNRCLRFFTSCDCLFKTEQLLQCRLWNLLKSNIQQRQYFSRETRNFHGKLLIMEEGIFWPFSSNSAHLEHPERVKYCWLLDLSRFQGTKQVFIAAVTNWSKFH